MLSTFDQLTGFKMVVRNEKQSFVVVANRLPVEQRGSEWVSSPGGLVSAVAPIVRKASGAWIGWAGACEEEVEPFWFDDMNLVPIQLESEDFRRYYEGFSNATLWPLYHDLVVAPKFHRSWWNAYQAVNARFAQAAVDFAAPGATVWVHDFHLQLVPEMIRVQRPDVRIGFFSHIPFPSVELFAQLPWRDAILRGLLGADVIGFQRRSDVRNFDNACLRLLGADTSASTSVVNAYPISIDTGKITELARSEEVRKQADEIRSDLGYPETLIVGIDRLDYTKGIIHRLRAYQELLEDKALDAHHTQLVQVAVPSREEIPAYQELRDEVDRLVGCINGEFGSLDGAAVHYSHRSYSLESLTALYLAADVLLVSSLRDGMNLVAKEYVTARRGRGGALILSEFAGAADELDQALLVNPHDLDGLKQSIRQAVHMPDDEGRARIDSMADVVATHDVHWWARSFLNDLQTVTPLAATTAAHLAEEFTEVLEESGLRIDTGVEGVNHASRTSNTENLRGTTSS